MRDEKILPQEAWRVTTIRIPDEKSVERALREVKPPSMSLREVGAWGLLRNGRIVFTGRGSRGRKPVVKKETWILAEKREIAERFKERHPEFADAKFVDLTKAVSTPRQKSGAVSPRVKWNVKENGKVVVPERAVVLSDANPVGRFLAESAANILRVSGSRDVRFAVATESADARPFKPFDSSGYSAEARREVVRRLYDAGFTRVATVLEDLLFRKLKLFPGREDEATQIFGARGRAGLLALVLINDLSDRRIVKVNVNGELMEFPSSSPVDPTRARVVVKPKGGVAFRAVSHDEAVMWLVKRGVSPEDAELILERLWLAGVISYPRNNGTAVHPSDLDKVRSALSSLGRMPPDSFEVSEYDVGLYIVDGEKAKQLTGIERDFAEWLADRLTSQTIIADVTAEFYAGKSNEPVDTYYRENAVIEWSGETVDAVFPVVTVEKVDGGVPVAELVSEMQRLGIGTEATRGRILENLRRAGLVTGGEKIALTHNGKIVATTARLALRNATDVDAIKRIMARLEAAAVRNENVDKALKAAWRETFKKREEFQRELYRSMVPAKTKRKLSVEETVALGLLLYGNGELKLRDVRREVLGETRWKKLGGEKPVLDILRNSDYFEVKTVKSGNGKRVTAVALTPEGTKYAAELLKQLREGGLSAKFNVREVQRREVSNRWGSSSV